MESEKKRWNNLDHLRAARTATLRASGANSIEAVTLAGTVASEECFGAFGQSETLLIDARELAGEEGLRGSLILRDSTWTVYLFPSAD